MEFLDKGRLLIVGSGDMEESLKKRVKIKQLSDRVHFKGRIDPTSLKSLTSQASVGFSLEEDMGLNYRLALPNKIFDYIHAGVPVIVSDLPVMKNFVVENKVGAILKDRTPEALAQLITKVLSEGKSYDRHLMAAAGRFNWDKEKLELLKLIENLD
jgi:glycosyltransferase involved in cell wall biosynthesis